MAQPTMAVRIAANMAELKKNLAEGKDQIEAVRAGFTKLATSFQGDKIIQAAHNAAAAVESIGGASKLTEAEKARLNATVQRAIDKYAALGREAPKALQDLAAQTKTAEEKTSFLAGAAGKLVAAFSIAAIANVANKVLDLTGKLTDLQGKTGINTDGLQVLNYALGQSGVSLEQAGKAAVVMSRNLVDGNSGTAGAVKTLGLNIDALIASGPEQAFLSIGSAIAGVPDPMQRAALATEVFGRAGADLLPGFTTNMAALGEEARRSGAIISADLVAAGDAAGDSLTRLQGTGLALIANVFLPMAPGIEAIANWLGGALTSSLAVARSGVDFLVSSGMAMEVWLREMAVSVAETSAAVPVLGRMLGPTTANIDDLKRAAQESRDALAIFTAEGAKPAEAAVVTAAPVTKLYSESLDRVATSAGTAREAIGAMQGPSVEMLNLESRTLQETVKLNAALQKWATTNGAVLMPSIRQVSVALQEQAPLIATANTNWVGFAGSVQQNTAAAGASTGGFMATLKGLFGGGGGEGGGKMSQLLGQIGPQFASAFLGPGSAGDKMKAFATQAAGTLMGMIPGVGPFLQAFSGPIIEGLSKLASKAKDILSGIFGGPDAAEKEGRRQVAEYEAQLASTLTETQKLEAGTDAWKATVIRLRDAYIAAGRTEAEALADAERLWKSSKEGAGATARVIAEIEAKMKATGTAADGMADQVVDALGRIPRDVDIDLNFRRNGDDSGTPGFSNGSGGIRDFGRGTLAVLHGRERVQTERQMQAEQQSGGSGGDDLRGLIDRLEMIIPLAIRDGMQMAGAR